MHVKLFNHKNRLSHSTLHNIGRDAYIDWTIAVVVAALALVALCILAYMTYERTYVLDTTPSKSASRNNVFDEASLDAVIDNYAKKQDQSYSIISSYSGPADPAN